MFAGVGIAQGKVVTETFTSNTTWTAPAGVEVVNMLGNGASGQAAHTEYNYTYRVNTTINATRRDTGAVVVVSSTNASYGGIYTGPTFYCDPTNNSPTDPTYSSNRTCYQYTDTTTSYDVAASTGASATGLGQTFPGSKGAVAPSFTSKPGVTVVPNQAYSLVVPAGGSISLTYYKP